MKKSQPILLAICVLIGAGNHATAEELIIMTLDEKSFSRAENDGSLPNGFIGSSNRPAPTKVSPGVGGKGSAVSFSNEQTGRPDHYQSIEIPSDGMDGLKAFTIALWFKSDATQFNPDNPVGASLATTLFDTTADLDDGNSGIKIGLNRGAIGEQVYVYISDGENSANNWLSFEPRPNPRDGEWTFLAITFDGSLPYNRLNVYGADEEVSGIPLGSYSFFDEVDGTGDSQADLISIGDGNNRFENTSSHIGLIDEVYVTDFAMDYDELEDLRKASLQ